MSARFSPSQTYSRLCSFSARRLGLRCVSHLKIKGVTETHDSVTPLCPLFSGRIRAKVSPWNSFCVIALTVNYCGQDLT